MGEREQFDVIVVGAGLAGLTAAYHLGLRNRKVLVLEAAHRLGGKVDTCRLDDWVYERGALFAFPQGELGLPVAAGRRIVEEDPIGLCFNGRVIAGDSVRACLEQVGLGTRESLLLPHVFESECPQPGVIGADIYAALGAFFRVIHPGNLADYVPARRWDALVRHDVGHFEYGNRSLIEAFVQHIPGEIRTGCCATELDSSGRGVSVRWHTDDDEREGWAESVVLATPAPEARHLTRGAGTAATDFLASVRYGKGITLVLGLRNTHLEPFSYIVSPSASVNTFIFHHDPNVAGAVVVIAYVVAEKAEAHWGKSDQECMDLAITELNALNIGRIEQEQVRFSDVRRWPAVGPIISQDVYGSFSNACLRPADRVMLAGDYTAWDSRQMPYGMSAALRSGERAAEMVCQGATGPTTRFRPVPLASSLVSTLTDGGPEFVRREEDGTIAYYGLVLQAEPDLELERYLLGEAERGLWSYQRGYGITALDSALVMEGLLATGRHGSFLKYSAQRVVDEFYDAEEHGFGTIPKTRTGRAPYWRGTDCPATAYCAWLLNQIEPREYAEIIRECADYLRRKQWIGGGWRGKWFPSETIPVFYAVRLLSGMGAEFEASRQRAHLWLAGKQCRDGSWSGSVIETAAAVLALCVLGGPADRVRQACDWIHSSRAGSAWAGETILQYWFDDEVSKTFFHTCDKGLITTAWAKIALRAAEPFLSK